MTTRCNLLTQANSPVGDITGNHVPRVGDFIRIEGNNAALAITNYGSDRFVVTAVVWPILPGAMNAARVQVYVDPVSKAPGDLPKDPEP